MEYSEYESEELQKIFFFEKLKRHIFFCDINSSDVISSMQVLSLYILLI